MSNITDLLKTNFATRFKDFSISGDVMRFVGNPYCECWDRFFIGRKATGNVIEYVFFFFLQLELTDIQPSNDLQQSLQEASFKKF